MTKQYTSYEIGRILERWEKTFPDVDLGWGFPTSEYQAPMLERCLQKNDPREFETWMQKQIDNSVKNNVVW